MLVVVQQAGEQRIVDVVVHEDDATFADLGRVLVIDSDHGWYIDGAPVAADDVIVGRVFNGTVVADRPTPSSNGPGLRIDQVAGTNVGWSAPLRAGANVLGRSADVELCVDDPSTSGRHCRLLRGDGAGDTVTVTDLGSRNGTRVSGQRIEQAFLHVGDVMWAGSGVYRLARRSGTRPFLGSAGLPASDGRLSFNRPPRDAATGLVGPVLIPAQARLPSSTPVAFSIATVLAPVVMAIAMVLILGSARYAMFALLSPVIAAISWVEGRHRARREAARYEVDRIERTVDFERDLIVREMAEREARWVRQPDLCELMSWMNGPTSRLWERRISHDDTLRLSIGVGDAPWRVGTGNAVVDDDLVGLLDRTLIDVPVEVDLGPGEVVGIIGPTAIGRSVARGLVLAAAATTGPGDLRIVVAADAVRLREWGWAAWLPHASDDIGGSWVLGGTDATGALGTLGETGQTSSLASERQLGLLVVDGAGITAGRQSSARRLWSAPHAAWGGVVITEREDQLPSECTVVVDLRDESGRATVRWPRLGTSVDNVQTAGVGLDRAVVTSRAIARLDDPDAVSAASGLPNSIDLEDVGQSQNDPAEVGVCWKEGPLARDDTLRACIGVGPDGAFEVDLVADGPHALVAGTTGAGKSELLRTWITSLALGYSPNALNLVLIDYKGGSAFDGLAGLPHVVGMVTDLDEHLGRRALICLDAELRWREQFLRDRGHSSISDLDPGLVPRLVVIIDEFATLASELPDFLVSLVGIAQRGRSLGVHLILATQRPAGAVNDNIRANTNMRIALRMQDVADSVDVVGDGLAASFPRTLPGRAAIRLGPGELTIVQTAHVTGVRRQIHRHRVELAGHSVEATGPTTLARSVTACVAAFAETGTAEPRRPWPEPLGAEIEEAVLTNLLTSESGVSENRVSENRVSENRVSENRGAKTLFVAVADDPQAQRHRAHGWNLERGNLMIIGDPGSGVEMALHSIAVAAMAGVTSGEVHVHAIELLGTSLRELEAWPHVGGVVGVGEAERLAQLVYRHRLELEDRLRRGIDGHPRMFLLIDHLGGLIQDLQSTTGLQLLDDLRRIYSDGSAVGIHTVIAADRVGAVPGPWQSVASQKWMFRLGDPIEYRLVGLNAAQLPSFVPGRGVTAQGEEFQLVGFGPQTPPSAMPKGVDVAGPTMLRTLSAGVSPSEVAPPDVSARPWRVPIGLDLLSASEAVVEFHAGEHVLIAGAPRSGVSNTLAMFALQLRHKSEIIAFALRPSVLHRILGVDGVTDSIGVLLDRFRAAHGSGRGLVVLIDDAHEVDDQRLNEILDSDSADLIVAAGRTDRLRAAFSHWTVRVRESRTGVLLRPDLDLDGDLMGVRLPRSSGMQGGVGRGYLVRDGLASEVQIADVEMSDG